MTSQLRPRVLIVTIALAACTTTTRTPAVFEFHNNFWLNLHHFARAVARGMPIAGDLTADERATWDAGVAFYKTYAQRDLLLDQGMVDIKTALRRYEGKESIADAPIDPELRSTLERLAPIYRRIWWPKHEASNRAWIEAATPLVDMYASSLSARIAAAYDTRWPSQPIPIDLSVAAGAVCAYTTSNPIHTTIASTDPSCQNLSALEILLHEPSHAWGRMLQQSIARASETRHKSVPPQLWHAVLFYNAGELTRRGFAEHGVEYVEYAIRNNVYRNLCGDGCRERVAAAWNRRLNGSASIDEAIDALVASWPNGK